MDAQTRVHLEQVRPDQPTMVTRTIEPERARVREARPWVVATAEIVKPTMTTCIAHRPRQLVDLTLKHKCASCGRFRSSNYQKNHPIAPGKIPKASICTRCIRKRTASEESSDSHGKSRNKTEHYRLRRRWTASSGERISEFERGRPRQANHAVRTYSSRRPSWDEKPRTIVSFDGARSRMRTSEYSPGSQRVRVVRRIKYVDRQGRSLSRSRSRSRSMSRRRYGRRSRYDDTSSSENDHVRVRVRRVLPRSRSRSVLYRRPLRIVRSRDTSSFDDDYEHIPRHVKRVVDLEDDCASVRSTVRRSSQSMLVEPGTTYVASPVGNFGLESHHDESPVEVRSYTERVERPPSRTVRIVQVSPETQDAFRRGRFTETRESQRVFYEPRPPPIITRQVVEPAVQTITETKIGEPRSAPVLETHVINHRECPSPSISETHIVERRGRSRTPVIERRIIERRGRSPSQVYEKNIETRSRSRPAVMERDCTETSIQSASSLYETPRRSERRRRVKVAGRYPSMDSSDEYAPPGMPLLQPAAFA